MQKRRPNTSQTKHFAWKGCIFWGLQHLQKTCSKWPQKAPWNDLQIFRIGTGCLPKAMPKINIKVVTNKMHKNQIWDPNCSKIASQNGLRPLMFWCLVWHCLRSCLWEAPGPPKPWPNRRKNMISALLFWWISAFVAANVLSSRKNSQPKSL